MKIKFAMLALLIIAGTSVVQAQSPPLWGGMRPGPDSVGFTVLWKYDHSRTWKAKSDYRGNRLPSEADRPLRISVWYPAQKPPGASPMRFESYIHLKPGNGGFADFNKMLEDMEIGSSGQGLRGLFKSADRFDELLQTTTAAFLNAPPKKGAFPLIVYSLGQNDYTQENVVLLEFLASHGYVVATVPDLGTSPRRFQLFIHDQPSYEAQVRDLEFIIQTMRDFPNVDPTKLGAMGMSQGGVYSLLLAMRNNRVDAVVALDSDLTTKQPSYYYKYWEAPYFDIARTKAPLMFLYRSSDTPPDLKYDIAESLKYSDRYFIRFPHLVHADFNSYPMFTRGVAPADLDEYALKFRDQETAALGHQIIARCVLNFLDATLKGDDKGQQFISSTAGQTDVPRGVLEYEFHAGIKAPTEEEFYTIIAQKGLNVAIEVYREVSKQYPGQEIIREKVLNRIGYESIYNGRASEAVEVFKLNVEAYPQSAAAYDSLAEGYMEAGNKELAIKNYERSLELNPQNTDASEQLKKLRHQ